MSLLPDLGRLALCPTSGTNDSEAGPSRPPVGPHQRRALRQADILRAILLSMAGNDDDTEEACRAAARWCNLNTDHQMVCADGGYALLTMSLFPASRPKPPGVSDEDWFFRMCHEHQVSVKQELAEMLQRTYEDERAAANQFRQQDPEARTLFARMRDEKARIRRADQMVGIMKDQTGLHDAFLARRAARDATHPEEKEITQLMERAYQTLLKTTVDPYFNSPLYRQFKPYTNAIQSLRMLIFMLRYIGENLDTKQQMFRSLAKMLKENIDKLEQVMAYSREQAEAYDRMMQE
tara:strand:+ start:166 stop:1044 length:879 start_codon:yes stop_codon:yes gene_type:complete